MTDDNVVYFVIGTCFLFLLPFLDMGRVFKTLLKTGFLKAVKCKIKKKRKKMSSHLYSTV